jgi:putative Mn2+ efflux pump MntP
MKKVAGILLIVTSLIQLINNIMNSISPYYYEYYYESPLGYIMLYTNILGNIAFIFLGISLLIEKKLPAVSKNESISDEVNLNLNDVPSTGLNILSFLIPMVGLILYLMQKDKSPRKANSAGKAALWGVGVSLALGLISFIISFALLSSMY